MELHHGEGVEIMQSKPVAFVHSSVIVLFLDLLELSSVRAGVSDELAELGTVSERLYTDDETESGGAGLEQRVLRQRCHAWSTHQRLH